MKTISEISLARTKLLLKSKIEALSKDDSASLVGFRTFKTAERKARCGRNPQRGKEINIPARKVPKFNPGEDSKKSINKE